MIGFQGIMQNFVDQFEPDRADYLYRKDLRHAPIRVSRDERDSLIADFGWQVNRLSWVFVVAMFVSLIMIVVSAIISETSANDYLNFGALTCQLGVYLLAYRYIWNAPQRVLRGRPSIGLGRSRGETRAIRLSKLSWSRLAIATLAETFVLVHVAAENNLSVGWNRLWLVFGVAAYGLLAVVAARKWLFGGSATHHVEVIGTSRDEDLRPSWLRLTGGVSAGLIASGIVSGWTLGFVFESLKLYYGSSPRPTTFEDVTSIEWLLMYAAWAAAMAVGMGVGAIVARWAKTAWVVAVFHAGFFIPIYWLLGNAPPFLGVVFLPFVVAYFVWRSRQVRWWIIAGRDRALLAPRR